MKCLGARYPAWILWVVSLSSILTSTYPAQAQSPVLVEGLAAVVGQGNNRMPILRSDVEFRSRLYLTQAGKPAGAPIPEKLWVGALEELIGEALVAYEASRVRLDDVQKSQIAAEYQQLYSLAGGKPRFYKVTQYLKVSEEEIKQVAKRRALVGNFLRTNLEGVMSVTDNDIRKYYETGKHPWADEPLPAPLRERDFEEVRDTIRVILSKFATTHAVRQWVQILERRTTVQKFAGANP